MPHEAAGPPELTPHQRLDLRVVSDDGVHALRTQLEQVDPATGRLIVIWPTEQLRLFRLGPGRPSSSSSPAQATRCTSSRHWSRARPRKNRRGSCCDQSTIGSGYSAATPSDTLSIFGPAKYTVFLMAVSASRFP